MIELLIGIILIAVLILALSGKGRTMIKGFTNLFFEDVAKTSKGADAIYSKAIDECEDDYRKASNNVNKIAGMLETSKNNLEAAKAACIKYDQQCETLAKANRFDDVDIIATELEISKEEMLVYQAEVAKFTPMLDQAKQVFSAVEAKLKKLKKERKLVVRKIELNQQTKEMYDSLDEAKHVRHSDKLLESVKEGAMSSEEMATGARVVYESKNSTKVNKINADVRSADTSAYVESLRNKYAKK